MTVSAEFGLRDTLSLLRRRSRIIALTFLVVIALPGLALLIIPTTYSASTLILVDPGQQTVLDPAAYNFAAAADSPRVESEVEILRSDSILLGVVERNDLAADPDFAARDGVSAHLFSFIKPASAAPGDTALARQNALSTLRTMVTVERRGLTYIISVGVRGQSPEQAAELSNAIAELYIEEQVRSKVAGLLMAREMLDDRLNQASATMARHEHAYETFITDSMAHLDSAEASPIAAGRDELDRLSNERTQLQTRIADAEVILTRGLIETDEDMREAARLNLALLHDRMVELDARADTVRSQMRSDALANQFPADVLTRIYELQQTAEMARAQYQSLLNRSSTLQLQSELQIADSRIVSQAMPPSRSDAPGAGLIMLSAGFIGLGLGIGVAFLYDTHIGGITSESQLALITGNPVAGAVPSIGAIDASASSLADTVIDSPLSYYAEAMRRVRAELDRSLRRASSSAARERFGGHVIMVGSSVPGEGKTTTALALARTYALSGQKTLLIDCDLRAPSLHEHFGLEPASGLFEFLSGQRDRQKLASIVLRDSETDLKIVVGAQQPDVPTDQLLASAFFAELLAAAKESFDVVIMDSPPALAVVDGLYLAEHADAIALVVRWGSTPQQDVKAALASLSDAAGEATPVLAVLNRAELPIPGRYEHLYARPNAG